MSDTNQPKRIQRKRTKGWRMPENTVYVGRPTVFGNPVKPIEYEEAWKDSVGSGNAYGYKQFWCHDRAVDEFESMLDNGDLPKASARLEELRGKNLACYCPEGLPCHADVLLERANEVK